MEDKRQFRANMYRIMSDELGEIIKLLEERSPEALDKVRREIDIDVQRLVSVGSWEVNVVVGWAMNQCCLALLWILA